MGPNERPERDPAPADSEGTSARERFRRIRTRLPPVRLIWILLLVLGAYGVWFLSGGLGVASLIALPAIAVLSDLVFDRIRFERLRFPDAALTTGLLIALLLPPAVPLVAAGTITVAAITAKHVLRTRGRPWFNPASVAVVLGALLFGLAPAWWGSINEGLVLALGILLIAWKIQEWRLPVVFLGSYAALAIFQRLLVTVATGSHVVPNVLLLAAIDPSVLFFGLFMVVEPRTSPADRHAQPIFAVTVAAGAALLPFIFPTLAVFFALLLGNLLAVGIRRRAGESATRAPRSRPSVLGALSSGGGSRPSARWSVGRRAGTGILLFLVILWIAALSYNPATPPAAVFAKTPGGGLGGGGGGVSLSACQQDNASVPAAQLASLHKALGPSVILSYAQPSGVVVFYDPVNAVTVTETDMYEDFGFAEFNGDDYTVSGCVPP